MHIPSRRVRTAIVLIAYTLAAMTLVSTQLGTPMVARADDAAVLLTPLAPLDPSSLPVPTDNAPDQAVTGDSGASGATPGTTEVQTGDATSLSDTLNQVNTNTADVGTSTSATTITNDNDATTTVDAASGAQTGGNNANGGGGAALIGTGDAVAATNVINVVNTNIINSQGIVAFLNQLFGGGFDLSAYDLSYFFGQGGATTPSCSLSSCGDGMLTIGNTNDAVVTNSLVARAETGDNAATSTGDAAIDTGNAYASGNLMNLVNTNLINSHYLLVAMNNFGGMNGDITLPDADFFQQLMQGGADNDTVNGLTSITSTDQADITGSTTANAATGLNDASTQTGSTTIDTGDAHAQATTLNQANTNVIGGKTVYFLFNIFGNWAGGIQGLPDGLSWTKTPNGIAITSDGPGGLAALAQDDPGQSYNGAFNVSATNTAKVENDVHVYALTGENYAQSASGTASIKTGDAYASANVMNIVNTNIIGANWMLAIFNIFGDWNGNISFGTNDLWIGGVAETPNPTPGGSTVTYHFTVANRGTSDATNVVLKLGFDGRSLSFEDAPDTSAEESAAITWPIGTIKRGESKDFTYRARVGTPAPETLVAVPLTATVSGSQADANLADNTESLTITVGTPPPVRYGSAARGYAAPDPDIIMTKTAAATSTTASSTVDYTIEIKNTGGDAFGTLLTDTLRDSEGNMVITQDWPLDTIKSGESLKVTYSVVFGTSTKPGIYTNTAVLTGRRGNSADVYASDMHAVTASTSILVLTGGVPLPVVKGEVLGAAACTPLISSYLKKTGSNDRATVNRLQQFLHDTQGEESVALTGVYDTATIAAVNRFQLKHAADILDPWGIKAPTGNVYYTTARVINTLSCGPDYAFTLTPAQLMEIAAYRGKLSSLGSGKSLSSR